MIVGFTLADAPMPMTTRPILYACIALIAWAISPAPAGAAPMQPGLWELTMVVTADGQTETVPAGRGCISPKDIADPTKTLPRPNGQCTLANVQRTADRATYEIVCKDKFAGIIKFQNGPIKEHGVNGITQEALLTICADRLRSFQAGAFACRDNAVALTHIETALMWLQKRTRERMSRGVEGTNVK